MRTEVVRPEALPSRVATLIAAELRDAVAARGTATFAVSGGSTPGAMLTELARLEVPWSAVHLFQVDERAAPAGDDARNLTALRTRFLAPLGLGAPHLHAMPVDDEDDLDAVAERYAATLHAVAGEPPVLDVVQLGLGSDGHTASLVPGDPVLAVTDGDVAATAPYRGHRRVTLTFPAIDRARRIVWMVAGRDKAGAVSRLLDGDPSIPASSVASDHAVLMVDEDAATARPA